MDKTVPAPAAALLDFIGSIEAPQGYGTIYGNNQGKLHKPLTEMTVDEVLAVQPTWTRLYGSSAAGRYQFMLQTLTGLKRELGLHGVQIFEGNLQDRLAYHLLLRRGYKEWMDGTLSTIDFAKRLAMEWASLPVLRATEGAHRNVNRGQSYYAGDGLNKSLVSPERVEAVLVNARKEKTMPTVNETVNVPVSSPWYSKINWVQFAGPLASILALWGFNVSEDQVGTIIGVLLGIQGGQSVLTAILRTWFSRRVPHTALNR